MAGPAVSIAEVPVPDTLPRQYGAVQRDIRRLARGLEAHPAAVGRTVWHWYPDHVEGPPPGSSEHRYVLLLDSAVTLVDTGDDWLELTLDISWGRGLVVSAAMEVACWCPQNHNVHRVREAQWPVANPHELLDAFAAGVAMLVDVLDAGSFDPQTWRIWAGLPDAPAIAAP